MGASLVMFEGRNVRRVLHQGEWWFSVADVLGVLTDSADAGAYWRKLKQRLIEEGSQVVTNCHGLKLEASDGKKYTTDCANAESLFRIIQSVPSPKAEPFKRWLAQVGYERVQEIENPELASKRARKLYRAKGYSEEWIENRMRGIVIREELTDEWRNRGVREKDEFSILTAEISKATFGLTPSQYKKHKGLKRENLRDHMNDLELLFSMLGEASTVEITRRRDARGFQENQQAARTGGAIAGRAREELEKESEKRVVNRQNYLPKSRKKLSQS